MCLGQSAVAQSLSLDIPDDALKAELTGAALVLNTQEDARTGDVISLANGDYARLLAVMFEAGYYAAQISIRLGGREADQLSVLSPPRGLGAPEIRITAGRRFAFGRAEIAPLPAGTAVPDSFRPGRDARLSRIRDAARTGIEAWRLASHAKARLAGQSISARHGAGKLDVTLRLDPGPALKFGQVRLQGDSKVRARRLQKIADIPTGMPFDPNVMSAARERLLKTGAFQSVVLDEAEQPNADGTLDLDLNVTDAAPRRIGFGGEINSSEGLSVEAFWLHRNAFGGAERLRFDARVGGIGGQSGGIDYTLGATLTIPAFRRSTDTLAVTARVERLDEPTFRSDIAALSALGEREVSDRFKAGLGIGLRFDDSRGPFGARQFRHVTFRARATYDSREDKLAPRQGLYADLDVQPFWGLSGSASGLRLSSDVRSYVGLGASTVLAGRFRLGTVQGSTLSRTLPDFLFLSGGGGTVRGQDFQSLGVTTPSGRSGGRSFLGLSTELRQGVTDRLSLVAFADMGWVSADSDFAALSSHAGFGLGARYSTGLGPLRLDVGFPSDDARIGTLQLYIGLGEAF